MIKIDLKYKKQDYYSKQELENICKERKILLDEFIKYYNTNPKHYKLNKVIIEKSPKGLWIGKSIKIYIMMNTKIHFWNIRIGLETIDVIRKDW